MNTKRSSKMGTKKTFKDIKPYASFSLCEVNVSLHEDPAMDA